MITTGYHYATFGSWYGVQAAHRDGVALYYQAPLDLHPVPVVVSKVYKNGKLRISHAHGSFTAAAGHTDRFRWREANT
jgi:hypothetical protein